MHHDHRDDAGFTLVEVIVAMVVLAFVVSAVGAILVSTLSVTKQDTQRVAAAGIAQRVVEAVRSRRALDIVDGRSVPWGPVTLDGTTYSVVQDASYLATGSIASVCSGTGTSLGYKAVTETVTWPNMGSVQPVRADTVVSLGLNADGLDTAKGAVATLVQDSASQPVANVIVTVAGRTATTGADGCAVFADIVPGTYTASVNTAGLVGIQGGQSVSSPALGISAATITRYTFSYDRAGALQVAITTPLGYSIPIGVQMPVTLNNALLTPSNSRVYYDCSVVATTPQNCVSGSPRLATALYPGAYSAWAGACADSKPSTIPLQVTVARGGTTPTTAALGGVDVSYTSTSQPSQAGTVYAVHAADASCPTTTVWSLGSAKTFKVALPNGSWKFTTNSDGSAGSSPVVVQAGVVYASPVAVSVS